MRDQKPRLRKFACLAAIAAMLALSGRAAERDLDDLLLVRLAAPPEGRRAPLQVMDGNYQRLSGVCPCWNAMVARQCPEFDSRENQQRPISASGSNSEVSRLGQHVRYTVRRERTPPGRPGRS